MRGPETRGLRDLRDPETSGTPVTPATRQPRPFSKTQLQPHKVHPSRIKHTPITNAPPHQSHNWRKELLFSEPGGGIKLTCPHVSANKSSFYQFWFWCGGGAFIGAEISKAIMQWTDHSPDKAQAARGSAPPPPPPQSRRGLRGRELHLMLYIRGVAKASGRRAC